MDMVDSIDIALGAWRLALGAAGVGQYPIESTYGSYRT